MYGLDQARKNAQTAYANNQVNTASKKKLLMLLYDAAIRNLDQADGALEIKELAKVSERLVKTQEILSELMLSLDMEVGGPLAQDLYDLYQFMHQLLIQANIEKNIEKIRTVHHMLSELRTSWMQV